MKRTQLVSRDGQLQIPRIGQKRQPWGDLYHRLLVVGWVRWLLFVGAFYVVANAAFGVLYWLEPGCLHGADGSYEDAFAFSVQTFATIGYGAISPATRYANSVVLVESMLGLLFQALATGLAFAKFARPTARVRFSQFAVVTHMDGERALVVRMANERTNQVVEATVYLTFLIDDETVEGGHIRRILELKLRRATTPFFALSFSAIHVIDESSPLHGLTLEEMSRRQAQIFVNFVGIDDTFNQTVHARAAYATQDILFDHYHADIIRFREDGSRIVDYGYFDDVVADDVPRHPRPPARIN